MCAVITLWQSTYLYQNSHRIFGLEPLAIIHSLPWALLMWSYVISCLPRRCSRITYINHPSDNRMVTFFVALLLFCVSISNFPTRIFVSIASALLATLIVWCIQTAWESTEDSSVWQNSQVVFRRTWSVLFGRLKEFNPFHTHRRVSQHDRISMNSRLGGVRV